MDNTKWFMSKTLWANAVAIAAGFAAKQFGIDIDASTQVAILGVINLALRVITKTPISWS